MYALVENGVISIRADLPENWQNISHLPGLSAEDLATLGWYQVVEGDKPLFDPATQIIETSDSYTPGQGVSRSYNVRDASADEIAQWQAAADAKAAQETAAVKAALQAQAQALLDKSDVTILRCVSAQITVPTDWQTYRVALRSIVSSGTGTIPARPSYPAGT